MIRIYGASDDLVEIEGDIREELGSYDRETVILIGREDAGVVVRVEYGHGNRAGVWGVAFEPVDEDVPIPWPVCVEMGGRGYSAVAVVDCPPGTLLRKQREHFPKNAKGGDRWAAIDDKGGDE